MNNNILDISLDELNDPELAREVLQLIEWEAQQDALRATQNQQAIAAYNQSNAPVRAVDGLGPLKYSMDPTLWHVMHSQGFDFSSQKDMAWLANRYPEIVVRGNQRTHTCSVGYVPEFERNVRETVTLTNA